MGIDFYDPDDTRAMTARYAELGGGTGPLGDRPSERVSKRWIRAYGTRDLDTLAELVTDDWALVDHRGLGWDELRGREAWMEGARAAFAAVADIRVELEEVLACDDRMFAVIMSWRGTASPEIGGGPFELRVGHVTVVENGKFVSVDQYEPDDREAMLARYRELGGTGPVLGDRAPELSCLGERPPERTFAAGVDAFNRHDSDAMAALYEEDCVLTDHRSLGWEPVRGREAIAELARSAWKFAAADVRMTLDEVLARDDRVIAAVADFNGSAIDGGGELEIRVCQVSLVEDGKFRSTDWFDPDDRDGILARYAELGGGMSCLGERLPERWWRQWGRHFAARDIDAIGEMYREDVWLDDHRPIGYLGDLRGREALLSIARTTRDGSPNVRWEADEVLACDDRVIALRCAFRGRGKKAGEFEAPWILVTVIEDGLLVSEDVYDPDDRESALARFAALTRLDPRAGPAERAIEEIRRAQNDRDYSRLAELVTEDFYMVDHRALGWPEAHGRERCLEDLRSAFDASPDLRLHYDEVLAADDHVVVTRNAWRGTGVKAGAHEVQAGAVHLIRDGRWAGVDFYEVDDRAAMMARYLELGGRTHPKLGDTPVERLVALYLKLIEQRDLESIREMLAEDIEVADHRPVAAPAGRDPNAALELTRSALAVTSALRFDVEEVLDRDDRALAFRGSWIGTAAEGEGETVLPMTIVASLDGEKLKTLDLYEPDDTASAQARFAEVSRAALGPAARAMLRFAELANARELDDLRTLHADSFTCIDRRPMPWEDVSGGDGVIAIVREILKLSADAVVVVNVLDDDGGDVTVCRQTWTGTFGTGGQAEVEIDSVLVTENGKLIRSELFNPDQEQEIRTRAAELRADAKVSRNVVVRDRRGLPKRDVRGIGAYRELIDGEGELVSTDGDLSLLRRGEDPALLLVTKSQEGVVEEAIAMRAPQLADAWMTALSLVRGEDAEVLDAFPGAFALLTNDGYEAVRVSEGSVTERERLADRETAVSRAEELAKMAAWWTMARNFVEAINARDWEAFLSMYAGEYVLVDHRLMGWGELDGPAKMVEALQGTIDLAPSAVVELIEVLDFELEKGLGAVRQFYTGEWEGGAYEIAWDSIMVIENGRFTRGEVFGLEQLEQLRARMDELRAAGRPPERFFAEFCERWSSGDVERILELYHVDYVNTDHRKVGWEKIDGREDVRQFAESAFAAVNGLRCEVDEVLACDNSAIALRTTWRGQSAETGGEVELQFGYVAVVEHGLLVQQDHYDYDDTPRMLERFAELQIRT